MADTAKFRCSLLLLFGIWAHVGAETRTCVTPKQFQGDWYTGDQGKDLNVLLNEIGMANEPFKGPCVEFTEVPDTRDADGNFDAKVLFLATESQCYVCWEIYHRTLNVLQYKTSSCITTDGGKEPSMDDVCNDILPQSDLLTLFRKTLVTVNCKNTFEGVYHFSYEVDEGGGGVCRSPHSNIVACQEPGSPYVDNQVFNMYYGKCPEVTMSTNKKVRFQCLGSWRDPNGNKYAAVADLGEEVMRDRFKCMLTRDDQQRSDNTEYWTMSKWAQCNTLKSPYEGPTRLLMLPVVYGTQLVEPTCNFPRNFTGNWFTTGEFDTQVTINSTHIYFKTKLDEFTYRETYFTCQQNRDTRYLVTAVTVGKCEVDYVCYDFLPRHHNIIRWRMGKPYRMDPQEMNVPDYLRKKFRQACSWSAFTIDRRDIKWKYHTFLLDPPAPVDCPIAGRYKFKQIGTEEEQYHTRIRGITARPRHQIDCREYTTEFKSCMDNTKKIFVDAEYCDTVDHTGRPIGEYDEPDRELNCVGFWMEDMRSYMVTYDETDAVSRFRCWVYDRLDWRYLAMSRSTRASCGKMQTATSFRSVDGASLALQLEESERLFDECPMRFNSGSNPYAKEEIFVLGGAASMQYSVYLMLTLTVLSLVQRLC